MKKVLVVDDQPFMRLIYGQLLKQLPEVEVSEADNGNAAMGIMKVSKPDLILLDITMPGKDGLSVLTDMHNDVNLFEIPVIVITAHADEEHKAEAMKLGAKEFIDKVTLNDINLLDIIAKHMA
jgi:CheY-like chemotaxis protein